MSFTTIDFPFGFNRSSDGTYIASLATTDDQRKIWKNRILLVLSTRPGERVMRPNFGSNIYRVVFEPENVAGEIAREAISRAFVDWLPSLELREIKPYFDKDSGNLIINIIYGLPNGEPDSVTINTGIFNRSGELIQEITNG